MLSFVHLILQAMAEKAVASTAAESEETSFVVELCQLFGITGAPDLDAQLKPLLLLLGVLKGLPEEHYRRDASQARVRAEQDGAMGNRLYHVLTR